MNSSVPIAIYPTSLFTDTETEKKAAPSQAEEEDQHGRRAIVSNQQQASPRESSYATNGKYRCLCGIHVEVRRLFDRSKKILSQTGSSKKILISHLLENIIFGDL
jgi:hypothetical protein